MREISDDLRSRGSDCDDSRLAVLVCPGFHDEALTEGFVRSLPSFTRPYVIHASPVDALSIFETIKQVFKRQPVVAIGFSAGVVGLVGAIKLWQHHGGQIERLFAIDGWGVPTLGLPICRMSHDTFTHWSSLPLGLGNVNFYADPGVDHLEMWANPDQVDGWQVGAWKSGCLTTASASGDNNRSSVTAQDFLHHQLRLCFEALAAS